MNFLPKRLLRVLAWPIIYLPAIAAPAAVHASGFVNNGAAWLALPPEAKVAYVQGLSDSVNFIYVNDDLPTAIVKLARTRCLVEQKTTAAVLSDRITTSYTKFPAFAGHAPDFVYIARMNDLCGDFIKQERGRFGLP